jgi:hypothetical protein
MSIWEVTALLAATILALAVAYGIFFGAGCSHPVVDAS